MSALARAWEHEYRANPALARPGTRLVFHALTRREPTGAADALVSIVEDSTVDGLTACLERSFLLYGFRQRCDGVVVEHVAVVASGWAGATVNTIQGSILTSHVITDNPPGLTPTRAVDAARQAFAALDPAAPPRALALAVEDGPAHVLPPYGGAELLQSPEVKRMSLGDAAL